MSLNEIITELEAQLAAKRAANGPGMRVPYHGPFCSAPPSCVKDLERLVRYLKTASEAK